MEQNDEKITQSAFSKLVGVTPMAITFALRSGRLKRYDNPDGSVYLLKNEALKSWYETTSKIKLLENGKTAPTPIEPAPVGVPSLNASKAVKEAWAAKIAQLNFEERSGELISIKQVQNDAFNVGRLLRDQLMSMADRIAPEVNAETNLFRTHKIITDECRRVLESVKGLSGTTESK